MTQTVSGLHSDLFMDPGPVTSRSCTSTGTTSHTFFCSKHRTNHQPKLRQGLPGGLKPVLIFTQKRFSLAFSLFTDTFSFPRPPGTVNITFDFLAINFTEQVNEFYTRRRLSCEFEEREGLRCLSVSCIREERSRKGSSPLSSQR